MEFLQPESLDEALSLKAAHPAAVPIAGGTDVLVQLNFARRRPEAVLDLNRVPELAVHQREGDVVRLGAQVPYTRVIAELAPELPGLAIASRTVGSPQIRNRGTVGGNVGTCSPAGDTLPVLLATGSSVELASAARGTRLVSWGDYMLGPGKSAIEPDELVTAVHMPVRRGPQQYSKVGSRNAMVIAVASFALVLDVEAQTVRTGIGSAGPRILAAPEAEAFLEGVLAERDAWSGGARVEPSELRRFGELVAAAAQPIDDVRGTAAYRRHALGVLAARTAAWTWNEHREGAACA